MYEYAHKYMSERPKEIKKKKQPRYFREAEAEDLRDTLGYIVRLSLKQCLDTPSYCHRWTQRGWF